MKLLRIDEFTKMNEGAGSGYTLVFKGIDIDSDSVNILPGWVDWINYDNNDLKAVCFEVDIIPGNLDFWSAKGYYDGINSDYEGFELSTKIDGGKLTCVIDMESLNNHITEPTTIIDELSQEDMRNAIIDFLNSCNTSDLTLEYMYGGGWSHKDLDETVVLGTDLKKFNQHKNFAKINDEIICEIQDLDYNLASVIHAELEIPEISNEINNFFKNPERYYDID